ncbi:sphingosine-1-phosphate phosphatase 2 isoform X2 [Dunckerocampus dactyliophorus]|uniref:sphingosine-1-phosphate phosphatase 2 isoform X2 n=1 Tax=Dunckerocampus dactyliophorus TaxID=161453 RepID=UPI002404E52D|nr:sphingosine-1-phosphate phosphatase 2 isoform X2 [Dunckerocampus dactyliophorus]
MLEALAYLHDSELVAGFQRRCGLFLVEAAHRTRGVARAGTPNHIDQSGGLQKTTWSHQDSNCNYKYEENGCIKPKYEVRNWLLHILFLFSAGLGHEVFYITCLPCIHWNLDPFLCRRLVNMWALVMYIGQVMKDVLKLPRPLSPPVVKLETRVDAEYGLPSTHAMAATAISFTLLLSAPSRIQDVICGVLISALVLYVTYPFWESFEQFQLTSSISPMVALVLPLILSYTYPELEHYSTTRGDTTTILGVGAGCSVGYWINKQLGETFEPKGVLPVPLPTLTTHTLVLGTARFLVGVFALVGTRQVTKAVSLHLLYWWYNIPKSSKCATRRKEIEVPSKFATYTSVGIVHSFLVNRIFLLLGLV